MKTSTKIFLGLAGIAALGAYTYRQGLDNLQYGIGNVIISGERIGLQIVVFNPSRLYAYPVPEMFLNIFDSSSNYIGSVKSDSLQVIQANGYSILQTWILPDYNSLINLFSTLVTSQNLTGFIIHGALKIAGQQIEVNTEILPANS